MSDEPEKPAIDPSPANPLWVFVCNGLQDVQVRLAVVTDEHKRAQLEHEERCWTAIGALVDRWLKGKEKAEAESRERASRT